jgi:predicted RNA-binding Zn ribbon-like protein
MDEGNATYEREHPQGRHAGNIRLRGGRLCLDFTNTMDWHAGPAPRELLVDFTALVAWYRHCGLLGPGEAARLSAAAAGRPEASARALRRVREFREAVYRLFRAIAQGEPAPETDRARLNGVLAAEGTTVALVSGAERLGWGWHGRNPPPLDWPLLPIAWSAAELLTSADLTRVRQCAAEGCGWLFLDHSRNRSRQWCAMATCGNRAKARRHYRRHGRGPA